MDQKTSAGALVSEIAHAKSPLFDRFDGRWEMTLAEKSGLLHVLHLAKPDYAIEIGTANGGSLSAISACSNHVYSLDTDPNCRNRVGIDYANVEYVTGSSRETLRPLLKELSAKRLPLGFVLVDGDHSAAGVKADLEDLLSYEPICPMWIVMHDSFNPECRRGLMSVDWKGSPSFAYLEVDFVPGGLHVLPHLYKQMWGGLAAALVLPAGTSSGQEISISHQALFEATWLDSVHFPASKLERGCRRVVRRGLGKLKQGG